MTRVTFSCRHLYIPLFNAERCWAYAMELKKEAEAKPEGAAPKRNHLIRRLAKAQVQYALSCTMLQACLHHTVSRSMLMIAMPDICCLCICRCGLLSWRASQLRSATQGMCTTCRSGARVILHPLTPVYHHNPAITRLSALPYGYKRSKTLTRSEPYSLESSGNWPSAQFATCPLKALA